MPASNRLLRVMLSCLAATSALAQEPPPQTADRGAWSFQVENDWFAKGRTDRYYTNGLRVVRSGEMRALHALDGGGWSSRHLQRTVGVMCEWSGCDRNSAEAALDIHGGQNMYTPRDLLRPDPYPYDRPYAGWLYLGVRTHLADTPDTSGEASRLQSLDVIVGVVGPAAGAGKVQRAWHELINSDDPQGWGHQLRSEPTLQVSLMRMRRIAWSHHVDTLPYWRLTAGNVFTHAAAGAHLRLGPSLGGFAAFDPAPSAIPAMVMAKPRRSAAAGVVEQAGTSPSWYLFAAVEARAVARNIFIDGNTFRDAPSPSYLSRRPLVGDVALGFSVPFGDNWRLTYGHVWRSREFSLDRQPPRGTAPPPDVQRYGVVQIRHEQ